MGYEIQIVQTMIVSYHKMESWGRYLCHGVEQNSHLYDQTQIACPPKAERAKYLAERLERALRSLGLTPFSARVIIQYIVSRLERGEGEAGKLHRVIGYLLSLIKADGKRGSGSCDPYYLDRKGCPQIIPGLRAYNFWNPSIFPWVNELECKVKEIQEEFLRLRSSQNIQVPKDDTINDDSTEVVNGGGFQRYRAPLSDVKIVEHGKWNVCYLLLHGMDFSQNAKKCPVTIHAIQSVPGQYNHAFFSALAPGSHIGAHCGPTNKKLRCYFPIFVPSSSCCSLTVNNEVKILEEGKCIIFDDSYIHEAVNEDKIEPRINLIFDFWHPDLTQEEIKILDFINKGQQNAAKRIKKMVSEQESTNKHSQLDDNSKTIAETELDDDFYSLIDQGRKEGLNEKDILNIWGSYGHSGSS